MIIGPNYVFIAVPRTASHAIAYHWLVPFYGGAGLIRRYHKGQIS